VKIVEARFLLKEHEKELSSAAGSAGMNTPWSTSGILWMTNLSVYWPTCAVIDFDRIFCGFSKSERD